MFFDFSRIKILKSYDFASFIYKINVFFKVGVVAVPFITQ